MSRLTRSTCCGWGHELTAAIGSLRIEPLSKRLGMIAPVVPYVTVRSRSCALLGSCMTAGIRIFLRSIRPVTWYIVSFALGDLVFTW